MRLPASSPALPCIVSALVSLVSCTGYIRTPPDVSPVNGSERPCPAIDPSVGRCDDIHVLRTALTCGGDGMVSTSLSTSHGGATRIRAQFQDGSLFQGTLITPDESRAMRPLEASAGR
jgi:hypothetical protein